MEVSRDFSENKPEILKYLCKSGNTPTYFIFDDEKIG